MSTRTGRKLPPPGFDAEEAREASARSRIQLARRSLHDWRCAYCRQRFSTYGSLLAHDAACPEEAAVRKVWEEALARAKARETRREHR